MRYTTIIDISEYPDLYRSEAVRLIYLHLALKAGYHDNDRDLVRLSIRSIARETGLTISATRHALQRLEAAKLLAHDGPLWRVRKWVLEAPITPRPKSVKAQKAAEIRAQEEAEKKQRDEARAKEERQRKEQEKKTGKTQYMLYYESLVTKAAQGDIEAAQLVKQQKSNYEAHCKEVEANRQKQREDEERRRREQDKEQELKRHYGIIK